MDPSSFGAPFGSSFGTGLDAPNMFGQGFSSGKTAGTRGRALGDSNRGLANPNARPLGQNLQRRQDRIDYGIDNTNLGQAMGISPEVLMQLLPFLQQLFGGR